MNSLYLAHPYDYMAHYGTPGMKWGRRRFQNKDGSLTEAGKRRYARYPDGRFAPSGTGSTTMGGSLSRATANISVEESDADKRARLLRSSDPIELYNNRHLLSSSEINERINRINTETRLSEIAASYQKANSPAAKGKKIVDTMISTANTATKIYSIWNSDAGKAARKFMGLKVPGKNDNFTRIADKFKDAPTSEILEAAQRLEYLRRYERSLFGTDTNKK